MSVLSVTLEGPFFSRDPGKTLYQNIGNMLDKLAAEMQGEVRAGVESGDDFAPFKSSDVIGYTTSVKTGKHWSTWAAVGVVGSDSVRAAAAAYEGQFHPFRKVKSDVYRARAILSADLAKNLE